MLKVKNELSFWLAQELMLIIWYMVPLQMSPIFHFIMKVLNYMPATSLMVDSSVLYRK